MKLIIKEQFPTKSQSEIEEITLKALGGTVEEWVWQRLLQRMYSQDDCEFLTGQILAYPEVPQK